MSEQQGTVTAAIPQEGHQLPLLPRRPGWPLTRPRPGGAPAAARALAHSPQ